MGKSMGEKFNEILKKMEEEEATREDVVLQLNQIRMTDDGSFMLGAERELQLGEHALSQLCSNVKIPVAYVKRILNEEGIPELIAPHFNHFFKQFNNDDRKMFRFKNGLVQGIVSEQYSVFDNLELLHMFADASRHFPDFEVQRYYDSDRIMHMRVIYPELEHDFGRAANGKKDNLQIGIDLINSETGYKSISMEPMIYRLVCTNGMRAWEKNGDALLRKRHIYFDRENFQEDVVAAIGRNIDDAKVSMNQMLRTKDMKVELPFAEIEKIGKSQSLTKKQIKDIKGYFGEEPQNSMYGIINAFTAYARDRKSHETRLEIEKLAGQLLHIA